MKRWSCVRVFGGFAIAAVAVLGCGKPMPDASPSPTTAPESSRDAASEPTIEKPATATGQLGAESQPSAPRETAEASSGAATSPRSPDRPTDPQRDALRALLARLVRQDAAGWSIDDQSREQLVAARPDRRSLVELLSDDAAQVRRGASYALVELADAPDDELAAVAPQMLRDADNTVRRLGIQALQRVAPEHLPVAQKALHDLLLNSEESAIDRSAAARLLARLPSSQADSVAVLRRAIQTDSDPQVRKACLYAVSRLASPNEAVPIYRWVLQNDADPSVQRAALSWLIRLRSDAAAAASDAVALLEKGDASLHSAAADLLVAIGQPSVEPAIELLHHEKLELRRWGVVVLGRLGPAARPAVPQLRQLADKDAQLRELALAAIRLIESP